MLGLDRGHAEAIAEGARAELARRRLLEFAERGFIGWQSAPHLVRIATLLEAIERGELRRLIVNLPPRHGKSLLCSQLFPAWFLGRNPRKHVIIATHTMDLSETNSRAARLFVQDERWPFATQLSSDSTSVARWNLIDGGGIFACGVDSNVTGHGADVLVLDDLQHDSGTEGDREKAWRWFCEIAVPRLEPGAAIIGIGTRFAEDDVFGRMLSASDAAEWTVLRLPAIAEEGDPLGRAAGDALWPQRVSIDELHARKRKMGSRWFDCQFQQNPMPAEGNLVKAAWLQRYSAEPPEFDRVICSLDAAAKTGVANDYSAIATIGVTASHYYVLEVERRKVEFPELVRWVKAIYERRNPGAIYVEDTSNATALIQQLRNNARLPIVPVRPAGSKISRVEAITGALESGRVLLPREAPWLDDFERELLAFPNAKHDDQVDAFAMAIAQSTGRCFYVGLV